MLTAYRAREANVSLGAKHSDVIGVEKSEELFEACSMIINSANRKVDLNGLNFFKQDLT